MFSSVGFFCIEKSEVRLGDKETIDFETAGTDGRYQMEDKGSGVL